MTEFVEGILSKYTTRSREVAIDDLTEAVRQLLRDSGDVPDDVKLEVVVRPDVKTGARVSFIAHNHKLHIELFNGKDTSLTRYTLPMDTNPYRRFYSVQIPNIINALNNPTSSITDYYPEDALTG